MMEKILDIPRIWNRHGAAIALDYRRAQYDDVGHCIDAPEFFPAGSIESFDSVVYTQAVPAACREVEQ